jgi:hypothetical protein
LEFRIESAQFNKADDFALVSVSFFLWRESKHLWQYYLRIAYAEKFSAISNDLVSFMEKSYQ